MEKEITRDNENPGCHARLNIKGKPGLFRI